MSESYKDRVEKFTGLKDGLENVMTGLGGENDKSSSNSWVNTGKNKDHPQLTARYREDWIAQKVCNIIPQDMTREWRMIDTEEGVQADKEFNVRGMFRDAQKWARVYGTSCILLDLKGTGDISKPLNLKRLKPNCIRTLQVVDRTRLFPVGEVDYNPLSPNYGNPQTYILGGSSQRIHSSRILRFEGTELTRYEQWRNQWYSDSVLIPLMTTMDNFHVAAQSASALTQEACADVVTVEGLQNILTNPTGEQAMMKRFRIMKQMKSVHNIILLDSTEAYDTKTLSLSGVKDLIWEYLRVVAAAVGVPATRFLSASPDGMNATGESDLNNYIDMLKGHQVAQFDPRLKVIDKILQAHYDIPPWEYEWNCIFPESEIQKTEREKTLAETLQILVNTFIISADEAKEILRSKQTYKGVDLSAKAPTPPPETKPNGDSNAKK